MSNRNQQGLNMPMQINHLAQDTAPNMISLRLGLPDPTTLDTPEFREAVHRVMTSTKVSEALQYGDEPGNAALIHYLVQKINREQRLSIGPDQLMIVAGSTHAVDMTARLYTKPGDNVIVEAPTYVDTLHIFRDHGVNLHAVPVDQDGINFEALQELLKNLSLKPNPPRLLYTIPNFHNPTGVTLNEQRRVRILQLARQYNLTIVEDDVYRDLAFDAPTPPSFFALADGVNTIQIGSFSKTLAPGLRLGWIAASSTMIHQFVNCGTTLMGGGSNPFAAQIVAEYCQGGYWETHIEQLRNLYRQRCHTMLTALARYMPPEVSWTKPSGGFFVWVTLPAGIEASVVKQQASERGVSVAAGEGFFVNPADGRHNLRLCYTFASTTDIETAVRILAEVVIALAASNS
jgi:2-aminoadipate transaminase